MEEITKTLSTLSTWAVSITAILAALSGICKPFRNLIKHILRIGQDKNQIVAKIDDLQKSVNQQIKDVHKEVLDLRQDMRDNINEVRQELLIVTEEERNNEKDRLKQVIFDYGNTARKKEPISSEQFRNLQQAFSKYTSLGGNDIAHDEYNLVSDYYNKNARLL